MQQLKRDTGSLFSAKSLFLPDPMRLPILNYPRTSTWSETRELRRHGSSETSGNHARLKEGAYEEPTLEASDNFSSDPATREGFTSHGSIFISILACMIAVTLNITGCATINGAPEPVIDTKAAIADLKPYLAGDAVTKFYSGNDADRNGVSARDWRDRVISAYIEVANLRFRDYTQSLYSQTTVFNIGVDWTVLALSGAAAVASKGTANALAAASAGLVGAGAAINKDAYYGKTISALVAAMEANRKSVLLQIRTAQKNDEQHYSLSDAMGNLADYEAAGSIQGAISQITATATNSAAESEQQIQALFQVEPVSASVQTRKVAINRYVRDLAKNNNKTTLDSIADALTIPKSPNLQDERNDILLKMDQVKTNADMDALSAKLKTITKKDF